MTSRKAFLDTVGREVGRARAAFPATASVRPRRPAEEAEVIRRQMAERWLQALARFAQEFARVDGVLHRVGTWAEVAGTIARLARERGVRRAVAWRPEHVGVDVRAALAALGIALDTAPPAGGDRERLAHREEAAAAGLGVTGVDLAVAETGTLVLLSGPGRPRSTSLLPETHVAVFDRTRLVETLVQVGVFLEAWHAPGGPVAEGGAISLITGPSRTADIELTLNRGVHGPREVHAVVVEGEDGR